MRRSVLSLLVLSCLLTGVTPRGVDAAVCWRPPVDAPVGDPYREPACRWCAGNRGIEYATAPGTAVRAVAAGRVTFAGTVVDRRYVVVEHADGRRATYGLLATIAVRVGVTVVAGTRVGATGTSFHFGLRDGDRYVDPTPLLGRPVFPVRLIPLDGRAGVPVGPPRWRCGTPEKPSSTGAKPLLAR